MSITISVSLSLYVFDVSVLFMVISEGLDVRCEACQRFFRDGLTISFTKILTDEAVSGWKFEIHVSFVLGLGLGLGKGEEGG